MPVDTDWHFFTRVLPARRQTALLYAGRLSPRRERASPTCLYYGEAEHAMLHLSTSPDPPSVIRRRREPVTPDKEASHEPVPADQTLLPQSSGAGSRRRRYPRLLFSAGTDPEPGGIRSRSGSPLLSGGSDGSRPRLHSCARVVGQALVSPCLRQSRRLRLPLRELRSGELDPERRRLVSAADPGRTGGVRRPLPHPAYRHRSGHPGRPGRAAPRRLPLLLLAGAAGHTGCGGERRQA
ncbi:hypothetical protein D3C86_1008830 [compost metagenome]